MKTALTIGGSDPSGGAGIQGDLKTFSVLGIYGMSAITALTVQTTQGIRETVAMEPELVRKQIDAVTGDIQADAVKTGLLVSAAIIDVVEDCITRNKLQPYVCDPVIVARGGKELLDSNSVAAMKKKLFPLATVITLNRAEAATLAGAGKNSMTDIALLKDAAKRIVGDGAKSVVICGLNSGENTIDLYFDGKEFTEFAAKTQPAEKSHGAGTAFSAAIAGGLAEGKTLVEAIDQAKQLVNMAIQYSDGQGRGTAPVNVLSFKPKKK